MQNDNKKIIHLKASFDFLVCEYKFQLIKEKTTIYGFSLVYKFKNIKFFLTHDYKENFNYFELNIGAEEVTFYDFFVKHGNFEGEFEVHNIKTREYNDFFENINKNSNLLKKSLKFYFQHNNT